ncbi:YqhR family membrane protein [Bacillus songklensis]|uniref:YqhR family membrane protein n=1 Tax=Bacillus songklensis TaxID=1069116 RepID=A0ABV8B007_9BACI
MAKSKKSGQEKGQSMSFLTKVVVIGFVGGLFWSFLSHLAYIINLTEISPNLILKPWALGAWKDKWPGMVISILLIGVISIIAALIYFAALKRFKSMLAGIIYGVALWALVFYVLNPLFPNLKTVRELELNTIITTICFYILYGVFIGYSISFEAAELEAATQSEGAIE